MKRFIPACVLIVLGLLLRVSARVIDGFANVYQRIMNAFWVNTLGRFSSFFPFSLGEWLIVLIVLCTIIWGCVLIGKRIKKKKTKQLAVRFLTFLLTVCAIVFFLYEAGDDVYFYATPFSERNGFAKRTYETEELYEVCEGLAAKANALAPLVLRDENGHMKNDEHIARRVSAAVVRLGERYPELGGYVPRSKMVFFSEVMDHMNFSGIYSVYTYEANVNADMPAYNVAYSMSHELAHVKGIMPENEANFVAYLACIDAEDPDIAYSGALLALTYCGNELNRRDKQAWSAICQTLDARVDEDLTDNRLFWARYKGKTSAVTEALNDDFLISHGQTEGTKTYDRVVDLIVVCEKASQE